LIPRSGSAKSLPRIIHPEDVAALDFQQSLWENTKKQLIELQGVENEWPRNYPDACSFGGRYICQFINHCERRFPVQIDAAKTVDAKTLALRSSFSSLKEFKRCPEKFRLETWSRIMGAKGEESEEASWGGAFHRGIAQVYKNIKEIQENGTSNI
jgi:hypothetical protein